MRFNFIFSGDTPKLWPNKRLHCCCVARTARLCSGAYTDKAGSGSCSVSVMGQLGFCLSVIYVLWFRSAAQPTSGPVMAVTAEEEESLENHVWPSGDKQHWHSHAIAWSKSHSHTWVNGWGSTLFLWGGKQRFLNNNILYHTAHPLVTHICFPPPCQGPIWAGYQDFVPGLDVAPLAL